MITAHLTSAMERTKVVFLPDTRTSEAEASLNSVVFINLHHLHHLHHPPTDGAPDFNRHDLCNQSSNGPIVPEHRPALAGHLALHHL